ncbi:GDB1 (YPR184W) [Zygosaccharomyces parabailii]|nr:GDB1 (YPR184W) [Zygosaccharomyces parabailii]CDH10541.1 probable Glycogen debranching enzyme [Zygosaccharomyces bailii ISA1307]
MTLNRTVLLRLNGQGEPIVACSYGQGVLTLPSSPLPDGTPEGTPLFTVRLVITAGSPVARDGLIWTNCPPNANTEFDRHKFYKKVIHTTFHKDDEIDLDVYKPGPHCFYFSFRNRDGNLETTRKFYFVVPPILRLDGKFVQLNSIALQTVVSKWMGKDWDAVFERIAAKKYNMIHFTPLQHRGESNSPYSIYDQLEFDPDHFKDAKQVEQMVQKLHKKYKALTLTDVVFNHTANNSQWLREHPDSGYNATTAPHLLAAIELDGALLSFSKKLQPLGYPTELKSLDDLNKIMTGISKHVLQEFKLWEFYTVDVRKTLDETRQQWSGEFTQRALSQSLDPPTHLASAGVKEVAQYVRNHAIKEPFGVLRGRFDNKVDVGKFVVVLQQLYGCEWSEDILNKAQQILNELNDPLYAEYDADINEAMNQLYNRIKYLRLDDWGPKQGPVTDKLPLTEPYFTRFTGKDGQQYALANNGWIWDGNPLIDFASDKSKAYLRREVIVWGDCVKLRYGAGPFDSPYLWKRMADYVEMNAKIFDGFRIDNCHSTPLHVGEYFLDLARKTNPNLYVVAELFSGSEQMDRLYVERLGLSSLIREAMQACSEGELSTLVHKHGGRPIGSYRFVPMDNFAYKSDVKLDENYCTYDPGDMAMKCASEIMIPRILTAVPPHALLMDCTHDNETPNQKRTVEDTLPNAALVALCSSAIGSNFGYDEIFPRLLNLVTESRIYDVHNSPGIGEVKALLNDIREEINKLSVDIEDSEAYIHHDGQYITFHRTDVRTGKGWYLIARTKFGDKGDQKLEPQVFSHIQAQLLFAYSLERNGDTPNDPHLLKGIPTKLVKLEGLHTHFDDSTKATTVTLPDYFPQGSIAVFNTQQLGVDKELDHFIRSGALKATADLDFISLNSVLYHSDPEENDITEGKLGTYDIPNFGKLVYCGLQGWISVLRAIIFKNDLAHPLSENLRQGTWALDYLTDRLDYYSDQPGVSAVQQWLRSRFERIKELPFFLRPSYFALVVAIIYDCCRLRAMQLMPPNIGKSTLFVQSLALTSVQMVAEMKSTSIYPNTNVPSMAAGLPHFSTGWARCWGRDVFISLRGLLLTTGRFDVAENHILAFAKTLKHGLIPNLLDSGRNPRYNARDAAWFFIQAVQDYTDIVPNGEAILQKKVSRRFPLDDTYVTPDDPLAFSYSNTIEEIIYEIFSRHAKGIKYREANAGPDLDRVMSDKGFNVEVYVDWSTGFIHGGSQFNCGTWMDKMGESKRARSYGVPGTPRDGAAIEITGLLKSSLRFIIELNRRGLFKEKSVTKNDGTQISFQEWNQLVQSHFEQKFYIPKDSSQDSRYEIDRKIVNRRGIYKDLYHTGKPYEDYELRPNFLIAMTVAPELFTPKLALDALIIADQVIRGPLGMKTLDPSDYNYRPYYVNGEDSDDFATAKGRNYHQGPEWVWLYGFFLRAFSKFHWLVNPQAQNRNKTKPSSYLYQELFHRINHHAQWIAESPWAGITELTNKDGDFCNDSSPTQAWSTGCLLDMYYDMWRSFEC